MHTWSQLISCSYTQTSHMMMAYQPSLVSWRNTSISYPQTAHLSITILDFILKHNAFNFMDRHIHQIFAEMTSDERQNSAIVFLENCWKVGKLLTLNHISYEKRDIRVLRLLKLSHILFCRTCMSVHFPVVGWITQSGLGSFQGCQGSYGIIPNGPAGSVISFNNARAWSVST